MTEKMYEMVCKERFDSIEEKLDKILACQQQNQLDIQSHTMEIDRLKQFNKGIVGTLVFVCTTLFVQGIEWLRSKI